MKLDSKLPSIHVRKETRRLITAEATSRDMSIADIVRRALSEYINAHSLDTIHEEKKDEMPNL